MSEIHRYLGELAPSKYEVAYNLNQHNRAVLAAALFADHIIGPGESGPLGETLPPWAVYLRRVALNRGENRIHLADAFCGLCGVTPTGLAPHVTVTAALPNDLVPIGEGEGPWAALIVGAGDSERCVPPSVWTQWITNFLEQSSGGQVVLIGSTTERHRMYAIQDGMSPLLLGRVWDACGRTSLVQLAALLSRCQWVLGSDTGPLHLGAVMGARAMGFYIARARVHETGPYGVNHWVWQAAIERPRTWPIRESVGLMLSAAPASEGYGEWSLWQSGLDDWGAFYSLPGAAGAPNQREEVWRSLGRTSSATESYEPA
jgi:ADP-heptose:LPS heptosyltransferase